MKKLIFLCLLACSTCIVATSQKRFSNHEILDMVAKSYEMNKTLNGVKSPDTIYPGHKLTFLLQSGDTLPIKIEEGDNMWNLGKKALVYQETHLDNPIIDIPKPEIIHDTTYFDSSKNKGLDSKQNSESSDNQHITYGLVLLAAIFIVLIFIAGAVTKSNRRKNSQN